MASGGTDRKRGEGRPAVVLLSGGLDSMVVTALAREAGWDVHALTIDYNQRHRVELESAARIAAALGVTRHIVLPLDLRRFGGSALTDDVAVPKDGAGLGGMEDEGTTAIPVTYVPARNLIFLSLTLAWAEVIGARDIFIGVNALDYSGYPDCRPDFIVGFEALANLATKAGDEAGQSGVPGFTIHAPLQYLGKAEIATETDRLGLDAALSWSCYDPTPAGLHCGQCDACRLRHAGFCRAGLVDPTRYDVSPPVA